MNDRALKALAAVLPPTARVERKENVALVNGRRVRIGWLDQGWSEDARAAAEGTPRPDVVVSKAFSPGARQVLADAGIGWIDEAGGAEVDLGTIIVSKSGRPSPPSPQADLDHWTPAVLAVAEAVLCGITPTVVAIHDATGLSVGSCAAALRFLSDQDLLIAEALRGRLSGRTVRDADTLLRAYADAVAKAGPSVHLEVGVVWRDMAAGVIAAGAAWSRAGLEWAATGGVAAAVLAPHLTAEGRAEVYLDATTPLDLEAAARQVGLAPLEGGRLTLRPFPTRACRTMRSVHEGLCVAPWPRVYADVRQLGVRGEEWAEHLREVMGDR